MIWENTLLAISAIKSNKMRSALTMLGIIIGISAVIAIVTIGNALTASVSSNLSAFGTSNVNLNIREKSMRNMMGGPGGMMIPGVGGGPQVRTFRAFGRSTQKSPEASDMLSVEALEEFKNAYPDKVEAISLSEQVGSATAKDKDLYANVSIIGVNPDYQIANTVDTVSGRFISQTDLDKIRNVCVVSDKFCENMFGGTDGVVGQDIKVFQDRVIEMYTIVGIYEYEEAFGMSSTAAQEDISTNLYVPLTLAQLGHMNKNFSNATIVCKTDVDVISFTEDIQAYWDKKYANNTTWGPTISSMESQIETITETLGTISLAVSFIAAISLIVGGIGVMNIMLVSVTERTREIGTRKAIGAKNFHIRFQFVVEAVIVSVIGGIIGVILGTGIGIAISIFMKVPVAISVMAIIVSVLFSMGIGVFFGYYPANKAAKLDPIEALRYE